MSALRRARSSCALVVSAVVLAGIVAGPAVARDPSNGAGAHRFLGGKAGTATAASVPVSGFTDSVVLSGFTSPTAVRFAPDGRVVVAEKSGRVWVYPTLTSGTRVLAADLSTAVQDFWDRGLLGIALDPAFATNNVIYLMYTYDHILGDSTSAPRWGDTCPSPPGATSDGCVVSARLSRFQLTNNVAGPEQVLVEDWC